MHSQVIKFFLVQNIQANFQLMYRVEKSENFAYPAFPTSVVVLLHMVVGSYY